MSVDWISYDDDILPFEEYRKKHPKMPLKTAVENFNYSVYRKSLRHQQKSKSPIKINFYG